MAFRRINVPEGSPVTVLPQLGTPFGKKHPQLISFFYEGWYEAVGDNAPEKREGGTMLIKPKGRQLQVTLKEPSQCLQAVLLVDAVDEVWDHAELLLAGPQSVWEVDQWAMDRKPKGKKK